MVTKIKTPVDINRPIHYNQHKVAEGLAKLIHAGNFLKDAPDLSLVEKKQRFAQLIALNQRVEYNALHIAAAFAPGENISLETMIEIACEFMDRIGFGGQPFLVYQHFDTAHPHLHIVTTNIRADGSSIDLNFIGRDKSEPARKAIEEKYGLVKAQQQKKTQAYQLKPVPVEKLQYGKRPTKQAITNALEYILDNYRYRSLPELNAILRLYNLKADAGQPGGRIRAHGGLLYQMLDEKGQGIGVPIKASSIYFKPGLKWLKVKFEDNRLIDPARINRVRSALDSVLQQRPRSWASFTDALGREQIAAVPYINRKKFLYGISFIDLDGKIVIKASDLGKAYSTRAILERLGLDTYLQPALHIPQKAAEQNGKQLPLYPLNVPAKDLEPSHEHNEALDILFRPEEQAERLPYELSQKANKKKKNNSQKL